MNEKAKEIRESLGKLASKFGPAPTLLGTVQSVDDGEGTCVIEDDGVAYPEIRLHPIVGANESAFVTPKKGAYALAVRIENTQDWYLMASSAIDKWNVKIGTAEIEQDSQGLLIKKGDVTLKEILTDIISSVQVIAVMQGTPPDYAKLTAATTKINNLLK